jgi:hypothetical protein
LVVFICSATQNGCWLGGGCVAVGAAAVVGGGGVFIVVSVVNSVANVAVSAIRAALIVATGRGSLANMVVGADTFFSFSAGGVVSTLIVLACFD